MLDQPTNEYNARRILNIELLSWKISNKYQAIKFSKGLIFSGSIRRIFLNIIAKHNPSIDCGYNSSSERENFGGKF